MTANTSTKVVMEGDAILGRCIHYPKGWLFISNTVAHKNGRVFRDTPEAALPKWVMRRTINVTSTTPEISTMADKTVASEDLEMDALTLMDFLTKHVGDDHSLSVVYVQDDQGRIFDRVSLVEETLTDGSKVHNLILSSEQ